MSSWSTWFTDCERDNPLWQLTFSACAKVTLIWICLSCFAVIVQRTLGLPDGFVVQFSYGYFGIAICLSFLLPQHLPYSHFGPANSVTLIRAGLVVFISGFTGHPNHLAAHAWLISGVATIALLLDGIDGWLARRSRMQTPFGARFDVEVDALFILVLVALVWQSGKAGAWVLLSGSLRYIFLIASLAFPILRQPLPPARWRQAVCVLQTAVLIICLTPVITDNWSQALAAGALLALALSFARDIVWLINATPLERLP